LFSFLVQCPSWPVHPAAQPPRWASTAAAESISVVASSVVGRALSTDKSCSRSAALAAVTPQSGVNRGRRRKSLWASNVRNGSMLLKKVGGMLLARNSRIMIADFYNRSCAFDARFECRAARSAIDPPDRIGHCSLFSWGRHHEARFTPTNLAVFRPRSRSRKPPAGAVENAVDGGRTASPLSVSRECCRSPDPPERGLPSPRCVTEIATKLYRL
jgi:hypothetical protein